MSLAQVAREIGRTPWQTLKLLDKLNWVHVKTRRQAHTPYLIYDAHAVEVIKGLLGQPHRPLGSNDNWLTNYLTQGATDGTRRIRPDTRDPGTPGQT